VREWEGFMEGRGLEAWPLNVSMVLLFLQRRIEIAKSKGLRESAVTHHVYALDFYSKLRGEPLLACCPRVGLVLEAAKRLLGRPTKRKRSLTKELVKEIARKLINLRDLNISALRLVVFLQLSYVMEARFDEASRLTPNSFVDYGDYIVAYIEDAKTDKYREGEFVRFEDSKETYGVCNLLRLLLTLIPEGTDTVPIFRRVQSRKSSMDTFRDKAIGYTRLSELTKEALFEIGEDPFEYGLHSARVGAASLVANQRDSQGRALVPIPLQEKHGR
jgi:hypothetical protein